MNTTSTTDGQPTVTWVLEAKFKELTAEEINQVAKDCKWDYDEINIVDFARAILRKASEK